eukprot:14316122-Heterocapsa_arctica.AAC.2
MFKPPGVIAKEAASPAVDAKAAKAKAKAKAAATKGNRAFWCKNFLKASGCPNSAADCAYAHLEEASVKVIRGKQAKAKAKAKAKAAAG